MSFLEDVRDEMTQLAVGAWGDHITVLMRGPTAARLDWRQLVDQFDDSPPSGLAPPWGVLEWGALTPSAQGDANDGYEWQVSFYYITRIEDGSGNRRPDSEIENEIMQRLNAMRAALRADGTAWQTFESPTMDFGAGMEANVLFLKKNMPMQAGVVRARVICGEAIEV